MEYSLLSSCHLSKTKTSAGGTLVSLLHLIELGAVLRSLTRSVELKNSTDFVVTFVEHLVPSFKNCEPLQRMKDDSLFKDTLLKQRGV